MQVEGIQLSERFSVRRTDFCQRENMKRGAKALWRSLQLGEGAWSTRRGWQSSRRGRCGSGRRIDYGCRCMMNGCSRGKKKAAAVTVDGGTHGSRRVCLWRRSPHSLWRSPERVCFLGRKCVLSALWLSGLDFSIIKFVTWLPTIKEALNQLPLTLCKFG